MAGFDIGSVYAKIEADVSGFKNGLDQAESMTSSFGRGLSNLGGVIKDVANQATIMAGVVGAGLSIFAKGAVDEYREAVYLNTKLSEVIMNRRGATQKDVEMLQEQAEALERVGVISGDSIVSAQAQLATFDFTADAIAKVIPSFLNLAVAEEGVNIGAEQMKQLANGLGKAMQGNTELFTKQGFVITDLQKATLKNGTEMERVNTIAEILGNTYDGLNESMAETFEGKMAKATINMANFKEEAGRVLSQALDPIVTKFNELFTNGSVDWFIGKMDELSVAIGKLVQGDTGAIKEFLGITDGTAGILLDALVNALKALGAWIEDNQELVISFLKGMALGFGALLVIGVVNGLLTALLNPLNLVMLAVALLYTAWEQNWGGIQQKTQAIYDWLVNVFWPGFSAFWNGYIMPIITAVKNWWVSNWDFIKTNLEITWKIITGVVEVGWSIIFNLLKIGLALLTGNWSGAWEAVKDLTSGAWSGLTKIFDGIIDWIKNWGPKLVEMMTKPFTEAWENIKGKMADIKDALDFTKRHSPSVVDIVNRGVGEVNKALGGLSMNLNPALNTASAMATTSSMVNIRVDMAGAIVGDEFSASSIGEMMGDSIIRKLQANLNI